MKIFTFALFLVGVACALSDNANNVQDDEISDDAARLLGNLDDIENALSDLDEMDSDELALALRNRNVGGWFRRRRVWKIVGRFVGRIIPIRG